MRHKKCSSHFNSRNWPSLLVLILLWAPLGHSEAINLNFGNGFGGAVEESGIYTFPSSAESWGGFGNSNTSVYPVSIENSSTITFVGSVPSGGLAEIYFKFEYQTYPNVDPYFDSSRVSISGANHASYSVAIPSQGSNTYSSIILYVVTPNQPVSLSNIVLNKGNAPTSSNSCDVVASQNGTILIQAECYVGFEGDVASEPTQDLGGGENLGWFDTNEAVYYSVDSTLAGNYRIDYRYSSENTSTLRLFVNDNWVDEIVLPSTNGWQNWATIPGRVIALDSGQNNIKLAVSSGGGNINWLKFSPTNELLDSLPNEEPPVFLTVTARGAYSVRLHSTAFNWKASDQVEATNNGDGTWTARIDPGFSEGMEYKWIVDGIEEDLSIPFRAGECTDDNVASYEDTWFNRTWAHGSGDVTSDIAGACSATYQIQTHVNWDLDKNGDADALTDGLLFLRYAFGVRGTALTANAVAIDSPLSTAEVEASVEDAYEYGDIDDDGNIDALTDGLLLIRYLFGLRGENLINNALSLQAGRSTAFDIEAYIGSTLSNYPSSDLNDNSPSEGLSKLKTQSHRWVDASGQPIALKGTNLGNWLLHEFWMMNQSGNTVATDQCRLEQTLDSRFGFDERERLMDLFRDNWINERDWDLMQSFEFNVIRLPFIWNLIEDENNPRTLRADAWQYIDYAIQKAEEHGMYVILDLHGAVGAQGENDHSGCAGQNLYWSSEEFKDRTKWLWQQIAQRYKDNNAVAAYGLLNEPWGTNASDMATNLIELYNAVRLIDQDKIIVLPGHYSGIGAYGNLDSFGGTNIAFDMHFYPGIFGWSEPGYEVHRDWLTCGRFGVSGVCEWDARMRNLNAPLLVGEFQPWATLLGSDFGAQNTRATYDRYAELGWAATSWSYKVVSGSGGQGAGTWGHVTNVKENLGLVAKASTWACPGWNGALSQACEVGAKDIDLPGEGNETLYLVVKFGTCCSGKLDVSMDSLSLLDASGNEQIINGDFGSDEAWVEWRVDQSPSIQFNASMAAKSPIGASGSYLNMTGTPSNSTNTVNGGIYQPIYLQKGQTYSLSGVFRDNGSQDAWAEIYITDEAPVDGIDVIINDSIPGVDFSTASLQEIETLFNLFGTIEYQVHQPLFDALTSDEPSTLYTLPLPPTGLSATKTIDGVLLSWNANNETDVTGYNIYRRDINDSEYELISENHNSTEYFDTISVDESYYYKITAKDSQDTSYDSLVVIVSASN